MERPADWLVPDWPVPGRVRAVFTSRSGGASAEPFSSFNLGDHVRDDPAAVKANRQQLSAVLGARPVFLQQVHGTDAVVLDAQTADGTQADACISTRGGVACTVMVADCLPVLFADTSGSVVAAAHAGWRGLAAGVLENCVARLTAIRPASREILVWLGPCIGPQAFEVGEEVREAFVAWHPGSAGCFQVLPQPGKFLADLPRLARLRLHAMGLEHIHGNDGSSAWCTVTQSARFFSHRRDAVRLGSTGRMAACVWLD